MNNILSYFVLFLFSITVYSCQTEKKHTVEALTVEETEIYLSKGSTIAKLTQKTLGRQLKAAIMEGGSIHALSYCNLAAMPLTDSLSEMHGVRISRLSNQNRNPQNKPDTQAGKVIIAYETLLLSGEKLKPVVTRMEDNSIQFYSPIMVGGLCLQCHGVVGEMLSDSTHAHIKKIYPNDLAVNYKVGNLRGIWSVNFEQ